jgi:hypothetical protein
VGEVPIPLPRPRRQIMAARPEFGELVARLLTTLGVPDEAAG